MVFDTGKRVSGTMRRWLSEGISHKDTKKEKITKGDFCSFVIFV